MWGGLVSAGQLAIGPYGSLRQTQPLVAAPCHGGPGQPFDCGALRRRYTPLSGFPLTLPLRRTIKTMRPLLLVLATAALSSAQSPITISVDASDAPRRIFHAALHIPAKPGPFTLLYPKWIPGEHGPTGPIADLASLRIVANGRPLPWHRDPVEMYAL